MAGKRHSTHRRQHAPDNVPDRENPEGSGR